VTAVSLGRRRTAAVLARPPRCGHDAEGSPGAGAPAGRRVARRDSVIVPPTVQPVPAAEATTNQRRRALRIRVGVTLVVVSWLPIAQLVIWLSSAAGDRADRLRLAIWGVQIVIGLIGVAIAGRETIRIAKSVGWRRSPRAVWDLLRAPNASNGP